MSAFMIARPKALVLMVVATILLIGVVDAGRAIKQQEAVSRNGTRHLLGSGGGWTHGTRLIGIFSRSRSNFVHVSARARTQTTACPSFAPQFPARPIYVLRYRTVVDSHRQLRLRPHPQGLCYWLGRGSPL